MPHTLGVFYERPSSNGKSASAGWYNTVAFEKAVLKEEGLYCGHINGDAFSDAIRQQTIQTLLEDLQQVDCVIYSLASPKRTDPIDETTYKSVLKPIGKPICSKTLLTDKHAVATIDIPPASQAEIDATTKVMGAEDWQLWIRDLKDAGALADHALLLAYSYIGPELTHPIYHQGTIGKAKAHLEQGAKQMREQGLNAYISVNKAVVTQASSAIPIVPLYLSILIKILEEEGLEEDCIHQTYRLFADKIQADGTPVLDTQHRIRLDDREMQPHIQQRIEKIFQDISTDTLTQQSAYGTYQEKFLKLFGFGLPSVDTTQDTQPEQALIQLKN